MKILNKIVMVICSLGVGLASCESPDLETGRIVQVNGLLNVTIQTPDSPIEYYATEKGPYEENEEIIVKVPTTDEEPLDLTRLICSVSLEHNCYVETKLGGEMNFSEPYRITVVDALGNKHNNTIRIVPTPPKTKFSKAWEKNCSDLGLVSRNNTGIAMNDRYLAIQEYDGPIYLYNIKTGAFVKNINAARSFMMKIRTDDAGHFVTARENIYSAGFMVFYYSEEEAEHKLLLDFTNSDGCPEDLGYNMSVIGDVTKGKSYIYGTGPNDMTIYYWELMDGQLLTPANLPNKLRYGPAGSAWTAAPAIQRASLDSDSEHYISYTKWVNGNDSEALKSRFNLFKPTMEVTALHPDNHDYRLLGFNVFDVEGEKYLAIADQGADPWAGGGSTLKVFDITNESKLELSPKDDGYGDFCIFSSDLSGWIQNYFVWGDIAVHKEETSTGYDVYIATSVVGFDLEQSTVRMYKMSYFRQ